MFHKLTVYIQMQHSLVVCGICRCHITADIMCCVNCAVSYVKCLISSMRCNTANCYTVFFSLCFTEHKGPTRGIQGFCGSLSLSGACQEDVDGSASKKSLRVQPILVCSTLVYLEKVLVYIPFVSINHLRVHVFHFF